MTPQDRIAALVQQWREELVGSEYPDYDGGYDSGLEHCISDLEAVLAALSASPSSDVPTQETKP